MSRIAGFDQRKQTRRPVHARQRRIPAHGPLHLEQAEELSQTIVQPRMGRALPRMRHRCHQPRRKAGGRFGAHRQHKQRGVLVRLPGVVDDADRTLWPGSEPRVQRRPHLRCRVAIRRCSVDLIGCYGEQTNRDALRCTCGDEEARLAKPYRTCPEISRRHASGGWRTRRCRRAGPHCRIVRRSFGRTVRRNRQRHSLTAEVCRVGRLAVVLHREVQVCRDGLVRPAVPRHRIEEPRAIAQQQRRRGDGVPQHLPEPTQRGQLRADAVPVGLLGSFDRSAKTNQTRPVAFDRPTVEC
jgi:hypothetical protein